MTRIPRVVDGRTRTTIAELVAAVLEDDLTEVGQAALYVHSPDGDGLGEKEANAAVRAVLHDALETAAGILGRVARRSHSPLPS